MTTNTEHLLAKLTADERASLLGGLIKREQKSARTMAVVMAAALAANLRVAGRRDLADRVDQIEFDLLKGNDNG